MVCDMYLWQKLSSKAGPLIVRLYSICNIRGFVILALVPRVLFVFLVKVTPLEAFGGNCIAFAQGRAAFSVNVVIRGRFWGKMK